MLSYKTVADLSRYEVMYMQEKADRTLVTKRKSLQERKQRLDFLEKKMNQLPFKIYWEDIDPMTRINLIAYEREMYESHLSWMEQYTDVMMKRIEQQKLILEDIQLAGVIRSVDHTPDHTVFRCPDLSNIILSYLLTPTPLLDLRMMYRHSDEYDTE